MKVAINRCWGGFGLSKKCFEELGFKWNGFGYVDNEKFGIVDEDYNKFRTDHRLIEAIEKIGEDIASGKFAKIEIKDIPDGINFSIEDYDGMETIHEEHRSW